MRNKTGSTDLIERLYVLYEQEMYRVCAAIVKDSHAAEDALSESFVKLIRIRDRIGAADSEKTRRLCIKTARNTAIDMYRRRSLESRYFVGLPETEDTDAAVQPDELLSEHGDVKEHVLSRLDVKYKTPVVLYYYEGLSIREVSAVLKISEACVRKRLERARGMIELEIKKQKEGNKHDERA